MQLVIPVLLSLLQHPLAWLGLACLQCCCGQGKSRGWSLFGVTLLLGTGPVHGVESHPNKHERR